MTMEKEILPTVVPEFPIVRRMTLGMNSPLVLPSLDARVVGEETAEGVHRWLGSRVYRIYSNVLLPDVRHQDKLMDNTSKEDEGLNASKVRGSGHLENARSSGPGEHAASLGRWKNDCGGKTHSFER